MKNNYPIEQQNQHEHLEFSYNEYIVMPNEMILPATPGDLSADVEIEMSRTVYDMRREFRRSVAKFKHQVAEKKPEDSIYKLGYTYPTEFSFSKRCMMG